VGRNVGNEFDMCHVKHISRKKDDFARLHPEGETLKTVDSATYLGIELTSNLSWEKHITNICNNGIKILGFVKRTLTPIPLKPNRLRTNPF
jgi:hypothetical protein